MKQGMLFEAVVVMLLILLSFTLYLMVATGPSSTGAWTVSGLVAAPNRSLDSLYSLTSSNMFVGDNGILYTIDNRNVHAIDKNGSVMWSVAIPDYYNVTMNGIEYNLSAVGDHDTWMGLDAKVSNGTLYMLVVPTSPTQFPAVLLAISSDGMLEWKLPFSNSGYGDLERTYVVGYPRKMTVINDSIYVDMDFGKAIIAANGTYLWKIDGYLYLSSSVGEDGNIYAITADLKPVGTYDRRKVFDRDVNLSDRYPIQEGLLDGTILGGSYNAVTSFYPNGTARWHRNIEDLGVNATITYPIYLDNDPIYCNGTIFVWFSYSIMALDKDGNLEWSHTFDGYNIERTWLGPNGSLYVKYGRDQKDILVKELYGSWFNNPLGRGDTHIAIIRPDGHIEEVPDAVAASYVPDFFGYQEFNGDTVYKIEYMSPFTSAGNISDLPYLYFDYHDYIVRYLQANGGKWDFPRKLNDLDTIRVTAYKINSSDPLWSYTIPLNKHMVRLDRDNVHSILMYPDVTDKDNNATPAEWYQSHGIPEGSEGIGSACSVNVVEGDDIQYISLWSYDYEIPTFYGDSRCVYSGGVFALSSNGSLLWSKEMDSRIEYMKEINGTLYYSTSSGKLSSIKSGAIAGLFTAAVYVFLRFFLAGAVTRVRGRINKNENRNRILQFIIDKPGSGLYDISQKLGINMGTARYHLLILGLNHKIVQYRSDAKYIRYFTNSASYSPEEQYIISLMRRDGIGKVLILLLKDPGMSNVDLSKALNVQESVTSRYMKELLERGVVAKAQTSDGRLSYSVKAEYNDTVGSVAKRLNGS
jgi:predicted transcriptional regulator